MLKLSFIQIWRQPIAIAILLSLGIHGLVAINLPRLSASPKLEKPKEPKSIQVVELTPALQNRLPQSEQLPPSDTTQPQPLSPSLLPSPLPPTMVPSQVPLLPPLAYLPQQPPTVNSSVNNQNTHPLAPNPGEPPQDTSHSNKSSSSRRSTPDKEAPLPPEIAELPQDTSFLNHSFSGSRDTTNQEAQTSNEPISKKYNMRISDQPLPSWQNSSHTQPQTTAATSTPAKIASAAPTRQGKNDYVYNSEGTSEDAATQVWKNWQEKVEKAYPHIKPKKVIDETLNYPPDISSCPKPEPGVVGFGVVVSPSGEIVEAALQMGSTGYKKLNEIAREETYKALGKVFQERGESDKDKYLAYQFRVIFNKSSCQPRQNTVSSLGDNRKLVALLPID